MQKYDKKRKIKSQNHGKVDIFPKLLYNGNMQIILKPSEERTSVRKLICQLNPRASFKAMHREPLPLAVVGETGWLDSLSQR